MYRIVKLFRSPQPKLALTMLCTTQHNTLQYWAKELVLLLTVFSKVATIRGEPNFLRTITHVIVCLSLGVLYPKIDTRLSRLCKESHVA